MFHQEIIIAGFGGQGILSAGRLLAYAGMIDEHQVSWLPSYGPEMRGGTANSMIVISEETVASPILNSCSALIVMNNPSLQKFESHVRPGGVLVMDNSIIDLEPTRTDIQICKIPASIMASDLGEMSYSIVFLLGKLLKQTQAVSVESFEKALYGVLPKKKHYMIPEEMKILQQGMDIGC